MTAKNYDILIEQGVTYQVSFVLKDGEGDPINLTGYYARITFNRSYTKDCDKKEMSLTSGHLTCVAVDGKIEWMIPADETDEMSGSYVYDFEIESADGIVRRLMQGAVKISPSVSK